LGNEERTLAQILEESKNKILDTQTAIVKTG